MDKPSFKQELNVLTTIKKNVFYKPPPHNVVEVTPVSYVLANVENCRTSLSEQCRAIIASLPGLPTIQFLIACSILYTAGHQKLDSGKAGNKARAILFG